VEVGFARSSRCESANCVEVAFHSTSEASSCDCGVRVRDSKDPGPVLTFTTQEWAAFVEAVKAGGFDG
jgi:hypothetical protein